MTKNVLSDFYKKIPLSKEEYLRKIRNDFRVPAGLSGFQNAILFGAENLGKKFIKSFRENGTKILAFSDNDKEKWGKLVEGIPVIPPHSIEDQPYSFVVITSKYVKEIDIQLRRQKTRNIFPHYVLSVLFPKIFPDVFYPGCFAKIQRERSKVIKAYGMLSDAKSKKLYLQLLDFMIDLSPKKIPEHSRAGQYFPDVLPLLKSKETYIDVGAYDGDTLQDFLFETGGHFNKYIALEPDRVNFKKLVKAIPHKYEKKILPLYAAASSKNGYVSIWHGIDNGIDSMISSEGHDKVRSVTIDSICKKERITSIKMDIEGHEPFALRGAGKILKRDKPKLAICVYHQPEHLWSLLLQIKEINPEYSKFYLRHHERERYGTVLYAK